MERSFRTLFVLYSLLTYLAGFVLAHPGLEISDGALLAWLLGLVIYIISSITIQIMHHRDHGPLWHLPAVAAYPFLMYYFLFHALPFGSRHLWQFIGYTHFLISAGGFISGIFFSPLIAMLKTNGLRGLKATWALYRGMSMAMPAAVIFCLAVYAALAYILSFAMRAFLIMTQPQIIKYLAYLLAGILLTAALTYRHTLPGIQAQTPKAPE